MVRISLRDFVAAMLWPSAGTIYCTNFKTSANHLNVQRHKLKTLVWYSEQDKHGSSNSARWTGSIQTVTTTTTNHFCSLSLKKGLFQVFLKQHQQRGQVDSSYNINNLHQPSCDNNTSVLGLFHLKNPCSHLHSDDFLRLLFCWICNINHTFPLCCSSQT